MHIAIASSSAMSEHAHSFRPNFLSSERTYRLANDGLECVDGGATQLTPYRDIVEIQEYKDKVRGPSSANQSRRFDYELRCRDGQKIVLKSKHSVGLLVAEDRSSSCNALVGELSKRVAEANPEAKFSKTLRWVYKLDIAAQGVRDWREVARPRHPQVWHCAHRFSLKPGGLGERSRRQHQAYRADIS